MFLVRDPRTNLLIFIDKDPRQDGFMDEVESNVSLEYPQEVHEWPDGASRPQNVVGVREDGGKEYRVFRSDRDRREARYKKVADGTPLVVRSWQEYALRQIWADSLKALPVWVDVESGAIPAWNSLPPKEQKAVAKCLDRLRRLPVGRWSEAGARRLHDAEPSYLLRVSPDLVIFLKPVNEAKQIVIENIARQEMLNRYFGARKESVGKS